MYKIIENYFTYKDARGEIKGLINFDNWQEVNYISSNKGSVRGGHYHKKTKEVIIVLKGKIEAKFQKEDKEQTAIFTKGNIILIEPFVIHTFKIIEDTEWINLLSVKNNEENPDIYKVVKK